MRMLGIPAEVANDAESVEVLRVWIDGGRISASIASSFGADYDAPLETSWGMLLSDAAHHLVDAIVLETKQTKKAVRAILLRALGEVQRSGRDTTVGAVRVTALQRELPIEVKSPKAGSVELLRVFKRKSEFTMVLFVGVWLKQGAEEQNWANILYDVAAIIASTLREKNAPKNRDVIVAKLREFIETPTTTYTGSYEEGDA